MLLCKCKKCLCFYKDCLNECNKLFNLYFEIKDENFKEKQYFLKIILHKIKDVYKKIFFFKCKNKYKK